jgi:DNA invertase Pin-like site-specific DNA recombinase
MRVALYARVSRADKDQDPENQLLKLREYAARHQWAVYAEFYDYVSGAAPVKPALEKVLREGRARHYDAIVIVRLDRLARSTKQLLNLLEDLHSYGVALICTDQQIDTKSPAGKLLFTVLGAVAELELDLIRERTKDGLERARAQGKKLGRPPKPEMTEEIMRLRAQGLSLREIGARVGMSHQAVKQRLRRARLQNGDENGECVQRPAS